MLPKQQGTSLKKCFDWQCILAGFTEFLKIYILYKAWFPKDLKRHSDSSQQKCVSLKGTLSRLVSVLAENRGPYLLSSCFLSQFR